jgi:hypothetical protein
MGTAACAEAETARDSTTRALRILSQRTVCQVWWEEKITPEDLFLLRYEVVGNMYLLW